MGTWQNGQGFNQGVAKKCGSKWDLGKMDRALLGCGKKVWVQMGTWQNGQGFNQGVVKKCGSKWEFSKMDRALIRMWQKCVGQNGNLAKWIGL